MGRLLTNFPRGNIVRLAEIELFLEYCFYAGLDAWAGESDAAWPGQGGLWTGGPLVRGSKSAAWQWASQVPSDPTHSFFSEGRAYV